MKLAVTYENGQVFQHFGRTQQFKLYDIAQGAVQSSTLLDTGGDGHGALAGLLQRNGVDTLICGGIGAGAQQALTEAGIRFFGGVTGAADEAVQAYLNDRLQYNPDVQCNHHAHESGGCGDE